MERLNKELKKVLLHSRQRLTLLDLAGLLQDSTRWALISQYGRRDVRGKVTDKLVQAAARHHLRSGYCQLPKMERSRCDRWLFFTKSYSNFEGRTFEELLTHAEEAHDIEAVLGGEYDDLEQARRLKKEYSVVHSFLTPTKAVDYWCTCRHWALDQCCSHTLCVQHSQGKEIRPEVLKLWDRAECYFDRPKLRRRADGRLEDQALATDIRYGIGEKGKRKRSSEMPSGSRSEPSKEHKSQRRQQQGSAPSGTIPIRRVRRPDPSILGSSMQELEEEETIVAGRISGSLLERYHNSLS